MSRTLAFIQARMSSSRLPGKVLASLQGLPLIVYMAQRAARARLLDGVVVVTSTDPSDDALVAVASAAGVAVFRGDLNDVLLRYVQAAQAHPADVIVRLTGDCPLIDPAVIDAVIDARATASADYASNIDPPSFPDGLDVECFTRTSLNRAHLQSTLASEREHVTLWMRTPAAGLAHVNHRAPIDCSAIRLTVDYADDLEAVRRLVKAVEPAGHSFDLYDLLRVLAAQPDILTANRHQRNEGLALSLAAEARLSTPTQEGT
jgi:spore coat polysaccharide biosynthesis protein SpsF